jgi:hypothetical protein
MALPEAVLAIAVKMKEEATKDLGKGKDVERRAIVLQTRLESFASELETAVKAAEGLAAPQQPYHPGQLLTPQMQHVLEIEKEKEEFRKKKKGDKESPVITKAKADVEEQYLGEFRELVGGPQAKDDVEATFIPIDPLDPPPAGAKTEINGTVYIMKDDQKFHYSEEETNKFQEKKSKIVLG